MAQLRAAAFVGRLARPLRELRTKGGVVFEVGERLKCVSAMRGRRRGCPRFAFQDPNAPDRYIRGVDADDILWIDPTKES